MLINLRPLGRGRFAASVDGRVLVESRTPIFDAARVLLHEGFSPQEPLSAAHEGSQVISMTTTIGAASKLTVIERDDRGLTIENYRPHPSQDAPRSVAVASQTAMTNRRDEFPSETENAFSDDHGREVGRIYS